MKLNLIGLRAGRLTVTHFVEMTKSGALWRCSCDCGGESLRITSQLRRNYKNLGCKMCETERRSQWVNLRTHGMCAGGKTKLYNVWKGMKSRCRDERNTSWKYYGAMGVTVCKEWQDSYPAFHAWSMENGYEEGLTIDRIDPYGNYEPDNCRWTTWKVQMNNLRTRKPRIEVTHG